VELCYVGSVLLQATLTREKGVPHEQLGQDAAKAPHVNLTAILQPKDDLRTAVKAALHIRVQFLIEETAAAKVNDLDGGVLGGHQQNVLWLQVAVDELVLLEEPEAGTSIPVSCRRHARSMCAALWNNTIAMGCSAFVLERWGCDKSKYSIDHQHILALHIALGGIVSDKKRAFITPHNLRQVHYDRQFDTIMLPINKPCCT
jgi:hypothetical protein